MVARQGYRTNAPPWPEREAGVSPLTALVEPRLFVGAFLGERDRDGPPDARVADR